MGPRLAVVAGEASGDLLGAAVVRALRAAYPDLVVEGVGGPRLAAEGLASIFPLERLAVNGLVEPLGRLPELLARRRSLARRFTTDPPDLFLGIDAPDFNLGLAARLRNNGVPTAQLVSPSVWAWRPHRVRGIARAVDRVFCLLPFEPGFYTEHGVTAEFVGHPLAEELAAPPTRAAARKELGLSAAAPVLALLPGSRAGEVARLLPDFLATVALLRERLPGLEVVLPAASPERAAQLTPRLDGSGVQLVRGSAHLAMAAADSVLVASGTATLEAALLGRPMVVAYRMHPLSYRILRRMLRVSHVALPNL
ncbi:MAG: lipid-A-disaccharide synthase, partial [Halioglobus sp.]|nr:lipid-A-disaccharide synthase [Halioglobus sp.]